MSMKKKITRQDKAAWRDKPDLYGWFAQVSCDHPVKKKCPAPADTEACSITMEEQTPAIVDTKNSRTNWNTEKMFPTLHEAVANINGSEESYIVP